MVGQHLVDPAKVLVWAKAFGRAMVREARVAAGEFGDLGVHVSHAHGASRGACESG